MKRLLAKFLYWLIPTIVMLLIALILCGIVYVIYENWPYSLAPVAILTFLILGATAGDIWKWAKENKD